ncbi:MAG: iron ABC transporter permease [Selenomonadaceae bacterium]|nr:iron ABC transporter permease [Selenomonadaceae bacterium]
MKIFKLLAICTITLLGFVFSLVSGSVDISTAQVFTDLFGVGNSALNQTQQQILENIRLPRTIVAVFVGINLSLSGAILQAVMKNPLADPHIIGISSGAGLFGIFVMMIFDDAGTFVTPAAFIGALLAAFIIYLLAWKDGIRPIRIILAGVAVSAFLGAGISALLIFYSDRVHGALLWMVGGLSARSWQHVGLLLPYSIVGSLLALLAANHLNILQLGDEVAKGLGLRVNLVRSLLTAIAALLAASAVCVVGLLGFVGLIVPHAARLILGSDYRILLPGSALLGAAVLSFSDTFARTVFAPTELPVGILMAVLGAPFFLYLLRKEL